MSPKRLSGFFAVVSALFVAGACGGEGPKGPAGDTGEPGETGATGDSGTPGADGTPGTDGTPGAVGEPGEAGDPGSDALLPPGAGLKFEILAATLSTSGAPTATIEVTDASGKPIDLLSELEAGSLSPRLTIALRDATTGIHTSLYENTVAGKNWVDSDGSSKTAVLSSTTQAASSPGSLPAAEVAALWTKVSDGVYTYTWPDAPATAPTLTAVHTVGVFAGRTFEGVRYPASDAYSFTPSTGEEAALREVVADAACNNCHQNLTAHGVRRGVALCTTCHSPQTTDPETGNTVDMRVMIHKIHSGQDGYKIVGFSQNVFDFSHVAFAPPTNNVRNCTVCHQGADADRYTIPSRAACGSCHTTVDFPTHMGGQTDDSNCANCHQQVDVERFHSPLYDTANNVLFDGRKLEVTVDNVTNVVAGGRPVITFSVKVNDTAADITVPGTIQGLTFTIAGPTKDYSGPGAPDARGYIQYSVVSGGTATGVTKTSTAGQFTYTPPDTAAKLADSASGTVGIGLEATIRETKVQNSVTRTLDHAVERAEVKYFAVGGGTPVPRRSIVDNDKCNNCHVDLGMHGTSARKGVELCAMCHNPNAVNSGRVARYETDPMTGEAWSTVPNSIHLAVMIHKIHAGGEFVKGYALGGYPPPNAGNPEGSPITFEGVFPGDLGNCQTCHKPGTYGLPSAQNLPTKYQTWTCSEPSELDENNFCGPAAGMTYTETYWAASASNSVLPQKSACTSCHATAASGAHADLMTLNGVESCSTCHGRDRDADPLVVHQPRP